MSIERCSQCGIFVDTDFSGEEIEYIDDQPYCRNCLERKGLLKEDEPETKGENHG